MFKTQVIKELADAIYDLEIYVSRTVHKAEDYKIEDGLIVTKSVETVRNKILNELHLLDNYLFNHVDDGR
jgi:hypothetical protein